MLIHLDHRYLWLDFDRIREIRFFEAGTTGRTESGITIEWVTTQGVLDERREYTCSPEALERVRAILDAVQAATTEPLVTRKEPVSTVRRHAARP